jgi:arylsulfatase A-like enzyme/Tfp pilus assembly protein PilF
LAQQGVNFSRGRAAVPLTLPSHASLMTALYPVQHGIRDNGTNKLSEKFTTLAEVFKKRGYRTAAFVGSFVLDHRFGLNQGFDTYDDAMPIGMLENQEAERKADAVYSAFSEWLNVQNSKSPFFVWIHFYDPHAPYNPPEPFRTAYKDAPYAGEIAYTDFVIGKLLKDLKTRGFNNNIIAVAGDHGEGLGEHQEQTHSLLIYNSTIHVPMIIVAPGIEPGSNYANLSRLIDLGPTLLEYAHIPEKLSGSGFSLKQAIENKQMPSLTSVSESLYPKLNLGWSELRGIEDRKYRYIDAPKAELFDTVNDPNETQNQIQKFPQVAKKMKADLDSYYQGYGPAVNEEIDPETKEKLASLGYVSGSTGSKTSSNIDPKDKIKVWNDIQAGIFYFRSEEYQTAIKTFETVLKTETNVPIVYDNLCSAYIKAEQLKQAETCIQKAISNGVDFAGLHLNLGQIYQNKKQYDLAQKEFKLAIAMDELNVSAHYWLANSLRAAGKHQQAIPEYEKALQMNPRHIFAINGLAMSYFALKRNDEALKAFSTAVEYDPKNPGAHFNLAVQAERMNKVDEAIRAYKKFLELTTDQTFPQQRQKATDAIRKLSSNE